MYHREGFLFRIFFVFGGAVVYARAAAGAVLYRYLYGEFESGQIGFAVGGFKGFRSVFQGRAVVRFNADCGVRADHRAETALDARIGIPLRNHNGDVAFFVLGGSRRIHAAFRHGGGGQLVAAAGNHFAQHFFYERGGFGRDRGFGVQFGRNFSRIFYFVQARQSGVHGFVVLLYDFFAFFGIGFFDGFFNVGDGFFGRDYARDAEEGRLHDGVGAAAHAGFERNFGSVNDVHFQFAVDDNFLHFGGKVVPHFVRAVRRVDEYGGAFFGGTEHVVFIQEVEHVYADEISRLDEVRRADVVLAEADVGSRHRAGFFGVVDEIPLGEEAVGADDFHRVFVGAYGAVGTQTVEERGENIIAGFGGQFGFGQGFAGQIVVNADDEIFNRFVFGQVVKHSFDVGRRKIFGADTVAAADDERGSREFGFGFFG